MEATHLFEHKYVCTESGPGGNRSSAAGGGRGRCSGYRPQPGSGIPGTYICKPMVGPRKLHTSWVIVSD